jgi:hypothetical protein
MRVRYEIVISEKKRVKSLLTRRKTLLEGKVSADSRQHFACQHIHDPCAA